MNLNSSDEIELHCSFPKIRRHAQPRVRQKSVSSVFQETWVLRGPVLSGHRTQGEDPRVAVDHSRLAVPTRTTTPGMPRAEAAFAVAQPGTWAPFCSEGGAVSAHVAVSGGEETPEHKRPPFSSRCAVL